jgi:hypothetical protein
MPRADSLYGLPCQGPVGAFLFWPGITKATGVRGSESSLLRVKWWVSMADLLNAAQRNRITNVLRSLELDLRQARAALNHPSEEGILFRIAPSTPGKRPARIDGEIEAALDDIAWLARELGLEAREQDLTSKAAASLTVDWADLVDSTSRTLKRYGDVDSRLAEVTDERLERLAERALTIAHVIREDGSI